jgi:hypothetical protein
MAGAVDEPVDGAVTDGLGATGAIAADQAAASVRTTLRYSRVAVGSTG